MFRHLEGKVAVITGGAGIICSAIARGLSMSGIRTAIVDINEAAANEVAGKITEESGCPSAGIAADVLNRASLDEACSKITSRFGKVDFLINGAGGNSPKATTALEQITPDDAGNIRDTFFGLDPEGFDWIFALNFKGTLLPTLVFGSDMVRRGEGVILNISSMNSFRPLTKIPAYSAAKASVNNFTQWLAVHLAKTGVRVNAIAPGFFLTNQNRFLLIDEKSGKPTKRGEKIIANTPMGRYGQVEELTGVTLFLLSDLSKFITGVVIPVDGGYSAYGGV